MGPRDESMNIREIAKYGRKEFQRPPLSRVPLTFHPACKPKTGKRAACGGIVDRAGGISEHAGAALSSAAQRRILV